MTARQVYEALLIEINKVKAPSFILEDFNYFFNKAIIEYINTKYNFYDMSQQIDDDLDAIRVLDYPMTLTLQGNYYKGTLPDANNTDLDADPIIPIYTYLHILNCSVKFKAISKFKCFNINDTFIKAASRLQSSPAKRVEENYYFKPSYKNPYFYRNNTLLEIRSGTYNLAIPTIAYIDYLKVPETILLTQNQLDSVSDISQILEFPDYVVGEIIKILTKLLMENASDQRLQTNIPVNQSIIPPQQQR